VTLEWAMQGRRGLFKYYVWRDLRSSRCRLVEFVLVHGGLIGIWGSSTFGTSLTLLLSCVGPEGQRIVVKGAGVCCQAAVSMVGVDCLHVRCLDCHTTRNEVTFRRGLSATGESATRRAYCVGGREWLDNAAHHSHVLMNDLWAFEEWSKPQKVNIAIGS
jgi:hypothetical protein